MSTWERDRDYKPEQMPRAMTAEEVTDALGNGTKEDQPFWLSVWELTPAGRGVRGKEASR